MRKQLDPSIPILISNNVKKNHRSFIVLVGDKARDQVGTIGPSGERSTTGWLTPRYRVADCEPALLVSPIPSFCPTKRIVVLQERSGIHIVSTAQGD